MEPVAIIGMGCRLPRAKDIEAFWQLLRDGRDAIAEVPADRWDVDALYDPEPATPSKMNTRWGGFLDEVDRFDPAFFRISGREAQRMDPQQRLLLEVAWESLENAGIAADRLAGSKTGVFVGISNSDYARLLFHGLDVLDAHSATGTALSVAANRISYVLNLRGPSLVVDTACSSSLVAVHLACQSIARGESELCLVGGVNLILTPEGTVALSQARMMASDGRCKSFDARADGYVRGEGCAMLVLKPLDAALRDRDPVRAVILGSAVNQDGLTNGLAAPNGPSQQALLQSALAAACVEPADISCVEAQATGMALGDPIEVRSLVSVLMQGREQDQPCWLGSVKTNLGHLESAAGAAGMLKVALALEHRAIPEHLHFQKLNPYINLDGTPFAIPTTLTPWETNGRRRIAGISAFGLGGTNCHVILAESPDADGSVNEPPADPINTPGLIERPRHLLSIRAREPSALAELAAAYGRYIQTHPDVPLADICFTANTGRAKMPHRAAVAADSSEAMCRQLDALVKQSNPTEQIEQTRLTTQVPLVAPKTAPKIAFLFSGEGSQTLNMGRLLYRTQPVFRQTIDRCDAILRELLGRSLFSVLDAEPGAEGKEDVLLDETAYARPALFSLEYALAETWKSWGIHPAAVAGHDVGAYVAARVAGVFSLEDALNLLVARSQPEQARLERIVDRIDFSRPNFPIACPVGGQMVTESIASPDYWRRHPRETVPSQSVTTLLYEQGCRCFLEIGPRPVFRELDETADLKTNEPEIQVDWLPGLHPGHDDWTVMLDTLATLFSRGVDVDWHAFDAGHARRKVAIPTYPFQRQRYWGTGENDAVVLHDSSDGSNSRPLQQARENFDRLASREKSGIGKTSGVLQKLSAVADHHERTAVLHEFLVNRIANTLNVLPARLEWDLPLIQVGLDSLIAMELKNTIESELDIEIPLDRFGVTTTIADLVLVTNEVLPEKLSLTETRAGNNKDDLDIDRDNNRTAELLDRLKSGAEAFKSESKILKVVEDEFAETDPPEKRGDLFDKCEKFFTQSEVLAAEDRLLAADLFSRVSPPRNAGPWIESGGGKLLQFSSNDYLGLAMHEEVLARTREIVDRYGIASPMGSRLMTGTTEWHLELERKLAAFKRTEAAVVFPSGSMAMIGALACLGGPHDTWLLDEHAHASLVMGAKVSGSRIIYFRHNDLEHLESILRGLDDSTPRAIVVDGIYSMHGDMAPLDELVKLKSQYGARLFVDDAHGTGVLGEGGRGTAAHFGVENQVDIHAGTFSKAMGTIGGFVAGTAAVVEFIRYQAPTFVFSKSMPLAVVAATLVALELLQKEDVRREKLWKNTQHLQQGLRAAGADLGLTESPITPIQLAGNDALRVGNLLRKQFNIWAAPVIYPAVPVGSSILRLIPTTLHTQADLDYLVESFGLV